MQMKVSIPLYNTMGEKVKDVELNLADLKVTPEEVARAIRVYEFALHQGTKKAKTRGEVAYSKRKPWRQKGTGRARAGTRGSPIWVGGGVAHGPKPHTKRLKLNKKEKQRVFTWFFAQHVANAHVIFVDLKDKVSTKQAVELLSKIGILPFKSFYVTGVKDNETVLGFRNLEKVQVRRSELLSVFDLYHKRYILINYPFFEPIKLRLLLND